VRQAEARRKDRWISNGYFVTKCLHRRVSLPRASLQPLID